MTRNGREIQVRCTTEPGYTVHAYKPQIRLRQIYITEVKTVLFRWRNVLNRHVQVTFWSRRTSSSPLCTAARGLFYVSRYELPTYGKSPFAYAGPATWNSLPEHLRISHPTLNSFWPTSTASSTLETFCDSGLYKFTFYLLSYLLTWPTGDDLWCFRDCLGCEISALQMFVTYLRCRCPQPWMTCRESTATRLNGCAIVRRLPRTLKNRWRERHNGTADSSDDISVVKLLL